MKTVWQAPGGQQVATDQVLFNLLRRGIESDLLPWLRQHSIPIMAYSPIEQGRLLKDRRLVDFAKRHAMTPAQVALAWVLANDDVMAIPKTASRERLKENAGALQHPLSRADLAELDELFPPPEGPTPLEMI